MGASLLEAQEALALEFKAKLTGWKRELVTRLAHEQQLGNWVKVAAIALLLDEFPQMPSNHALLNPAPVPERPAKSEKRRKPKDQPDYVVTTDLFSPTCNLWEVREGHRFITYANLSTAFDCQDGNKNPHKREEAVSQRLHYWVEKTRTDLGNFKSAANSKVRIIPEQAARDFLTYSQENQDGRAKYFVVVKKNPPRMETASHP